MKSPSDTRSASDLIHRHDVLPLDVGTVRALVEASGFFSAAEAAVATELVEEHLSKGPESGYHFVFAERGEEALGYACYGPIPCTEASFDLYWIVVHPACQGQGIGRALLDEVEGQVRRQGGVRLYADTSGRAQYEPTRTFYARCGFQQAAFLEDFYAPGDGKVIFAKGIAP